MSYSQCLGWRRDELSNANPRKPIGSITVEISSRASWKSRARIRAFQQSTFFYSRYVKRLSVDESRALLVWTSSNITAGSDTTAIVLRTVFYQLLTHPSTLKRLLAELDAVAAANKLDPLASWKQTRDLPYLDACVKEAGRLHPPFGLPLERVVPSEGAVVCGQSLKGGTVVGMSAWVVHRNHDVFGEDCDEWNPERWLCEPEKRRRMENALLTVSCRVLSSMRFHFHLLNHFHIPNVKLLTLASSTTTRSSAPATASA